MSAETDYFDWDNDPAVVVPVIDPNTNKALGYRGFYYRERTSPEWIAATGANVGDFYEDGLKISKSVFEMSFGVIGEELPSLPT